MSRRIKNEIRKEDYIFLDLLKGCGNRKDLYTGTKLHSRILEKGVLQRSPDVASTLISMYAKCGGLTKARQVLDELFVRNVASWNALISGYAQHGQIYEAFTCLEEMRKEGIQPNEVTFTSILKACGSTEDINKGKTIHDEILSMNLLQTDSILVSALVYMYARCGELAKGQQVLDELCIPNISSWNALIAGYAEHGKSYKALKCFEILQLKAVSTDAITLNCILKASGRISAIQKGKQIHVEIVSRGLLQNNTVLGNALVDMYVKCGALNRALKVINQLSTPNIVSWSELIAGYAQNGQGHEALKCFHEIQKQGLLPNLVTFTSVLKVCGSLETIDKGKIFHSAIVTRGWVHDDIILGNALIDMYTKCGLLAEAHYVLNHIDGRDLVSWNTLIAGYAYRKQGNDALQCFEQMKGEGISPDSITFNCILNACANTGAINMGKQIHEEIKIRGLLEKSIVLGTALVDMYAKCGMLSKAQKVFDELPIRNVASWSALMVGYSEQGLGHEALKCFEQMQLEGLSPDSVAILCLLDACSHSGLVDQAEMCFMKMTKEHAIKPSLKHHTCMVNALGCTGQFGKVISTVDKNHSIDHLPVWLAILSSCRKWGNMNLGKLAFEKSVECT